MAKSSKVKVNIYRQIALTFVAAAVVLIFVILFVTMARARIIITPEIEEVSVDFIETIGAGQPGAKVPGKILQTAVTGSKEFESSYSEVDGDGVAQGEVVLINESSQNMSLVATTRLLSSDDVLFRLRSQTSIPANGQAKASVYADQSGPEGDIDPSVFSVPGLGDEYKDIVYAKSVSRMSGGSKKDFSVTQEDIDQAIESLKDELVKDAIKALDDEILDTETLLEEATNIDVLDSEVSAEVGSHIRDFSVDMTVEIQGLVAERDQIFALSKEKLELVTAPQKTLLSVDEDSLTYELEKYDKVKKSAQLKIFLSGKSVVREASALIDKELLLRKKKDEVVDFFKAQPGIKKVQVEFYPFWVQRVPRYQDHVEIIIKE